MILQKLVCTSIRSLKTYCLPRYFCEMGRRKSKWRNRQRGDRTDRDERGWMPTPVKENAAFVKYYQGLGLIPDGEWDQFLSKLKETLPVTFRITGYKGQAQELLKIIKGQYFTKFTDVVVDGNKVEPPRCLQWYPDGLAWQLDLAKRAIRGSDSLKRLHEFLVSETESGNISRQEAVSMIPPLLMDIKPDSKVLDMCAAPGSKTAQLIEYLHSSESTELPEGFVVANDSDNKRCYLMTHQVKRLQSPNCMIINHDATILPNLFLDSQESGRQSAVVYDRVLADVPCSGDGTFRKNQDLWRTWQPTVGASLHGLQLRIVRRGFELLGVGGRLVYSTCSLNPVEDEAVVAAIIRQTRGAVELVEAESMLPGLRCNKGVSSWKCMSRQGDWYEKFEDVPAKQKSVFKPTMFPPLPQYAHKYGLEKCLRVLPHHQDTGGFFIAVFKKTRALPWQKTFRFVDGVERTESSDEVASSSSVEEWWQHPGEKWDSGQGETTKQSQPAGQGKTTMQSDCDTDTNNTSTSDSTKTACTNTETVNSESHPLKSNVSETEENLDKKLSESEQRQNADSESKMEMTSDQGENVTPEKIENESAPNEESEGNETNKAEKRPADSTEKSWPAKKPKMGGGGYKEDPFFFLRESDIFWPPIKKFFGVSDSFPENQIMFRSVDGKRQNLYFVSENIKNIVQHNEDRVKFINLGVKIYGRSPSPLVPDCDYRLAQEGLAVMQKFSTCRRLLLSRDDLVTLLKEENPFLVKMSPEVQKQAAEITPGSTIFQYIPSESDAEPACEIVVCGWKGKTSLRSFVAKFERAHYLRLCGLELSDIQRQVAEKKAEKLSVKDGTKDNDGGKSPCEDKLEDNVDQGENPNDNANDSSTDIVNQNPPDDAVYPVAFDKPMGE